MDPYQFSDNPEVAMGGGKTFWQQLLPWAGPIILLLLAGGGWVAGIGRSDVATNVRLKQVEDNVTRVEQQAVPRSEYEMRMKSMEQRLADIQDDTRYVRNRLDSIPATKR